MKLNKKVKFLLFAVAGSLFVYFGFNWVMSEAIHTRKRVLVPDLKGRSLSDSITVLSSLNLGLKKDSEEYNQNLPAGTVIRQNPLPAMPVLEGKIVRVVLSQGGEVIFVPNVIDQPLRTAEITVRSNGMSLGEESSKYSVVIEKGRIVSQDPAAGVIVAKDSLINLVVSAGYPPKDVLLVPKLTGKDIDEAKDWSVKNGVELSITEESLASVNPGMILRQDPGPDYDITNSKKVIVSVSGQNTVLNSGIKKFSYEVAQGGQNIQLRFTLIDEYGEKEIFKGVKSPGSKLEIPISPVGRSKVRVFVNGILTEEKEVQ